MIGERGREEARKEEEERQQKIVWEKARKADLYRETEEFLAEKRRRKQVGFMFYNYFLNMYLLYPSITLS